MFGSGAERARRGPRSAEGLGGSFSQVVVRWGLDGPTADAMLGTGEGGAARIVIGSMRPDDEQCRRLGVVIDIDILGRRMLGLSDPRSWVRSACPELGGRTPLEEMLGGTSGLLRVRSVLLDALRRERGA